MDIIKTERIMATPFLEPENIFNNKNQELNKILIKKRN